MINCSPSKNQSDQWSSWFCPSCSTFFCLFSPLLQAYRYLLLLIMPVDFPLCLTGALLFLFEIKNGLCFWMNTQFTNLKVMWQFLVKIGGSSFSTRTIIENFYVIIHYKESNKPAFEWSSLEKNCILIPSLLL